MKNTNPLIKALFVAGIVAAMVSVSPLAHAAAALTVKQKADIAAASSQAALVTLVQTIIATASAAEKEALAKDIAAYVVKNVSNKANAAQVIKALVAAVPGSSATIILAAVVASPSIAAELKAAIPAQAANIDILVSVVVTTGGATTATAITSPKTTSGN